LNLTGDPEGAGAFPSPGFFQIPNRRIPVQIFTPSGPFKKNNSTPSDPLKNLIVRLQNPLKTTFIRSVPSRKLILHLKEPVELIFLLQDPLKLILPNKGPLKTNFIPLGPSKRTNITPSEPSNKIILSLQYPLYPFRIL